MNESRSPNATGAASGSIDSPAGDGLTARVLVVDDEASVADVCREFLATEGY